jgi:hypothetical protein
VIDPRGLSFVEWSGRSAPLLVAYGTVPIARSEHDWAGWAAAVISFSQFGGVNAPQPHRFSGWRDWALQFNLSVSLTFGI